MATSSMIRKLAAAPDTGATMPALFIGHGSPMNAIEDKEFSRGLDRRREGLTVSRCYPLHFGSLGE